MNCCSNFRGIEARNRTLEIDQQLEQWHAEQRDFLKVAVLGKLSIAAISLLHLGPMRLIHHRH